MAGPQEDANPTLVNTGTSDVAKKVMGAIAETAGKGKSEDETKTAVANALGISAAKLSAKDVSWLYKTVVSALIGVMGIAIIALSWTILDGNDKTSPDLLLTVFTGALGSLVGLFVRSPSE